MPLDLVAWALLPARAQRRGGRSADRARPRAGGRGDHPRLPAHPRGRLSPVDIAGARVLVTGGARRLGRAIALGLGERGAQVAFTYHRSADATPRRRPRRSPRAAPAVTRSRPIWPTASRRGRRCEQAASALGGLDVLVHAASGGFAPCDPMDVEPGALRRRARGDADGRILLRAGSAPGDGRSSGVIVNITDVAALEAWPLFAPHAAAKAALAQLTRSLARAFAPGVRVCAVAPGPVLLPDGSDAAMRGAARRAHRARPARLARGRRRRRRVPDRGRLRHGRAARGRRRPPSVNCL